MPIYNKKTGLVKMDDADKAFIGGINHLFQVKKQRSMDANEGFNLLRSLTRFMNRVYKVKTTAPIKYPELLPVISESVPMGTKQLGWYTVEEIGRMRPVANRGTDLGNLNVDYNEKLTDIELYGVKISWSWEEIEAAIVSGTNLRADLGAAARTTSDNLNEEITLKGDSTTGLKGILSDLTNMTAYGNVGWAGLGTVDAKMAKLKEIVRAVSSAALFNFQAGVLVLPQAYYDEIEDTDYDTGGQRGLTMLQHLLNIYNNRAGGFRVIGWNKLAGVTHETITNKNVVLAYPYTPEAGENAILDPLFWKPPKEDDNWNVIMGAFNRTAGVIKRQPKTFVYGLLN